MSCFRRCQILFGFEFRLLARGDVQCKAYKPVRRALAIRLGRGLSPQPAYGSVRAHDSEFLVETAGGDSVVELREHSLSVFGMNDVAVRNAVRKECGARIACNRFVG